ncbi:MAG: hypothetical protein E6767_00750 [Dysgonomonas sp.]|nr:hypothetical protein [Dysgonomonas sp.]
MKKLIYFIFFITAISFLSGCSNDDGERTEKKIGSVNILEFRGYKGSANGAVEVDYNNLRKIDLVSEYFGSQAIRWFTNRSIEFYDNRVIYKYSEEETDTYPTYKIVSEYEFKNGALYVKKSDNTSLFVAYGDSPDNLFLKKSFGLYTDPETREQVAISSDLPLNLDILLTLAHHVSNDMPDPSKMTDPEETIIWCNIDYLFE